MNMKKNDRFLRVVLKEVNKPPRPLIVVGDTQQQQLVALANLLKGPIAFSYAKHRDSELDKNIFIIHLKDSKDQAYSIYDIQGPAIFIKHTPKDGFYGFAEYEVAILTKKLRGAKIFGPPLFNLGDIVATTMANKLLGEDGIANLLYRHSHGDWGDIAEDSIAMNSESIESGDSILSKYTVDNHDYFIITDYGHELTTVMLTEEY